MGEHAHTGHAHGVEPGADRRLLAGAGALIVAFMCGEVVAGLLAHSLALLSDAAHMLTDAAAIGLALVAMKLAARPASGGYTYGLRRLEILSAQANGITLVLLALWLGYSAVRRLITPQPVTGGLMLAVAVTGVFVNLAATWLLHRARPASGASLNVEGAFAHILTDLYAFGATAVAAIVVLATGFARADPIATLVVVVLMLRAGAGLIRASGRIFLEAAPAGIDPAAVGAALVTRPHVTEVHDLHIWEITSGLPAASAHVIVARDQDCHAIRADLMDLMAGDFGITHATLQVDHVAGLRHCGDPHGPSYRAQANPLSRTDSRDSPAPRRHPCLQAAIPPSLPPATPHPSHQQPRWRHRGRGIVHAVGSTLSPWRMRWRHRGRCRGCASPRPQGAATCFAT